MRDVNQLLVPTTGSPLLAGALGPERLAGLETAGLETAVLETAVLEAPRLEAHVLDGASMEAPDAVGGEKLLQVGELAAASGKTVRAIHLYEELGLLRPDGRSKGRFRLYDPQAVTRVRWIGKLHDLGMSLSQIQEVVSEWEGAASAGRAMSKVRSIYGSKLDETRTQIARLQELERELTESIDYLDTCETCDSSLVEEAPIPDFSVAVVRRLPQIAPATSLVAGGVDTDLAPEVGSCVTCAMREREHEPELVAGIHHYPIDVASASELAARSSSTRSKSSRNKPAFPNGVTPAPSRPFTSASPSRPSPSRPSRGSSSRSTGE